tara:strand:+ start:64520 stop:66163 length:1644 start_codon:yes stop_codon:yes gene_type:complete
MKTNYFKPMVLLLVSILAVTMASCSKDENPVAEQAQGELGISNGIRKEELKASKGSIGIIIDARNIVKKGFLPVKAEVKASASSKDYFETLEIDEFTNLATLALQVEELSVAILEELKNGVPITVALKDKDDNTIIYQSFSIVSFRENGTFITMNTDELTAVEKPISFNTNIPYYIQLMDDGVLTNRVFTRDIAEDFNFTYGLMNTWLRELNAESQIVRNQFFLVPVLGKESTFYIKNAMHDFYLSDDGYDLFMLFYVENTNDLTEQFEFTLETSESGNLYIKNYENVYINRYEDMEAKNIVYPYKSTTTSYETVTAEFRIIPATIQWEVEALNTVFMKPILPAVETSFGFNSTLVNCSQGTLEQEVGTAISEETTTSVGWEESIELSSESTYEASATVSVTASASFFGSGVEATASASVGYSSTSGFTTAHTGFKSDDESKSHSFFSSRTIEVLPGTAVLVYDAYQTYSNVLVPFVQRFRVRGSDSNNNLSLNGDDIVSQFSFNGFNGVVTKIGSDFVEVTVRGAVTLDNLIDTQSNVQEVASNCN